MEIVDSDQFQMRSVPQSDTAAQRRQPGRQRLSGQREGM